MRFQSAKEPVNFYKKRIMILFGKMRDGREVYQYTLKNRNGITIKVINYGGIITSLMTPDKKGNFDDIVLGFDTIDEYLNDDASFGALVGRYANRIANASFSIDGIKYELPANNGPNCLHGGNNGFNRVFWEITETNEGEESALYLRYISNDGEEGFPGQLNAEVIYKLKNDDSLEIVFLAKTDKKTVYNPTQHSYFNLAGKLAENILHHQLVINATEYLPTDLNLIPDRSASVGQTPFDFRSFKTIGAEINNDNIQLKTGNGYDHCWVLKTENSDELIFAASLKDILTGRQLEILTTEPGIQVYTGNYIENLKGRDGEIYGKNKGIALETQHFPDSPNKPEFPATILDTKQEFYSKTIFRFIVNK